MGTGQPMWFECPAERRERGFERLMPERSAAIARRRQGRHKVVRTGRQAELLASQRGRGGSRVLQFRVEWECSCGKTGWTRIRDILRKPMKDGVIDPGHCSARPEWAAPWRLLTCERNPHHQGEHTFNV